MSFWNKVKKLGEKTLKEAQKIAAEIQLQREKAQLLTLLKKKDLIDLALDYDIPIYKGMTKDDLISVLSKEKKLTKDVIKSFIKRGGKVRVTKTTEEIEIEQIEEEIIKTRKVKKVRKISTIERKIERELKKYRPISRIKSEKDLERELSGSLSRAFGYEKVQTQKRTPYGRVDMVINDEYAIELKLASSYSYISRSIGPILDYADDFKKVYLLIYDERKVLKPLDIKKIRNKLPSNVELIIKP